jgi:hypothetical protein
MKQKSLHKWLIVFVFAFASCFCFGQTYLISTGGSVSTCSGTFYDQGGSGSNYGNNQNYTMTFCPSTAGQVIQVNFTSFATEATFDFLYIYDGNSTGAPLIGQFSGTLSLGTIKASTANATGCLTFKFTSDAGTVGGGWAAAISCTAAGTPTYYIPATGFTETTCSGTFYDNGGPSSNYIDGETSIITFCPSTPGAAISVNFTSFSTENCNCDKLTIYDGNSVAAPVIGTYTGTVSPGTVSASVSNASGCLTFKFVADANTNSTGWAATISCLAGCSGTPTGGTANASVTNGCSGYSTVLSLSGATSGTGISYQWQSSPDGTTWTNISGAISATATTTVSSTTYYHCVITCSNGGASATSSSVQVNINCILISNTNYTISSCPASINFYDDGGPGSNYADGKTYTQTITAPAGSCLSINFSSFVIESGCTCDFMYIYDGPSTASTLIGTYSGSSPGTVTSSGTSLTIKFTSDAGTNKAGWAAIISCAASCSGTPTGGTASASVTNGCSSYSTVLSLSGASSGCGISYQWQSSPNGSTWSNISGATATTTTTTVSSTTYYHCVTACGGTSATSSTVLANLNCILISSGGSVTTCNATFYDNGGSGSNYSDSKNYTMTICPSTSGQCIQAVFTSFNTESGYDFLTIYDANSTSSGYINNISGTLPTFTVTASTNNASGCLTFNFTSDGATNKAGWVANISCAACGTPYPAPNTDCKTAYPICSNSTFPGSSNGTGAVVDLSSSNSGCLDPSEHQSSWYYFKSVTTGTIGMVINPSSSATDYDWAIWGPLNPISCPPSGSPVRCSAADGTCTTGNITGMNMTVTDVSEGAGCGGLRDGWVHSLPVIAGDEYIMLIDNWNETGDTYSVNWQLNIADLSCDIIVLPIKLINFMAVREEEIVALKWQTITETNSDYFYVERSPDGNNFETIGSLKAGGNSTETLNYVHYDKNAPPGMNYYRLKQTDFNGNYTYSSIVSVNYSNGSASLNNIRPNPTNANVDFDFYSPVKGTLHIELVDNTGDRINVRDVFINERKTTISTDMENLFSGIYLLHITFDSISFNSVKKIIKQ